MNALKIFCKAPTYFYTYKYLISIKFDKKTDLLQRRQEIVKALN